MAVEELPDVETHLREWRVDQHVHLVMELQRAQLYKAWYRAAFGLTLGALLVVAFT